MRDSSPRRINPAQASTIASNSPASSRLKRVSTLPRSASIDEVRTRGQQLRLAPQARGAQPRALRQILELEGAGADQGIARIDARQHRGNHECIGEIAGYVLHGMHGHIGAPVLESRLEFFDEQALAADRRQAAILNAIALGGHRQQFHDHARMRAAHERRHVLGLPQRQLALTRRYAQRSVRRYHLDSDFVGGKSADFSR